MDSMIINSQYYQSASSQLCFSLTNAGQQIKPDMSVLLLNTTSYVCLLNTTTCTDREPNVDADFHLDRSCFDTHHI